MINGENYIAFLKFGKKGNLLKLQNGLVYMKESNYYRKLEKTTGKVGMGDKYDSCRVQRDVEIWVDEVKLPNVDWLAQSSNLDEKTPIFCCMYINEDDFIFDVNKKEYVLNSQRFNIEVLKEEFGEYVLVIPYPEYFIERIRAYCDCNELDLRFKKIMYVDYENENNEWKKYYKNDLSQFFIKDKKFSYQKEFRIILANAFTEQDEDYYSMKIPEGFNDFTIIMPVDELGSLSYIQK